MSSINNIFDIINVGVNNININNTINNINIGDIDIVLQVLRTMQETHDNVVSYSSTDKIIFDKITNIITCDNIETCCICSDEDSNIITICEHQFCFKCLEHWLSQHNTCPKCRTNIVLKECRKITHCE